MAEATGISVTAQLRCSLGSVLSAASGQGCGCSCLDAQGRGKACARNPPCRSGRSSERSGSGRELLHGAWSRCGQGPWARLVAGVLPRVLGHPGFGLGAACSQRCPGSAAPSLLLSGLRLSHRSKVLDGRSDMKKVDSPLFRTLMLCGWGQQLRSGCGTHPHMDLWGAFRKARCWNPGVRLGTGSTNGTGGRVCSPRAKPGSVCRGREQGGRVQCSLPRRLLPTTPFTSQ